MPGGWIQATVSESGKIRFGVEGGLRVKFWRSFTKAVYVIGAIQTVLSIFHSQIKMNLSRKLELTIFMTPELVEFWALLLTTRSLLLARQESSHSIFVFDEVTPNKTLETLTDSKKYAYLQMVPRNTLAVIRESPSFYRKQSWKCMDCVAVWIQKVPHLPTQKMSTSKTRFTNKSLIRGHEKLSFF